jgi:hypothetical protein
MRFELKRGVSLVIEARMRSIQALGMPSGSRS